MIQTRDFMEVSASVFKEIDDAFSMEVEFLRRLIQFPTVNPPGRYEEITSFLRSFAGENRLRAEVFETPSTLCKAAGLETEERRLSVKISAGNHGVEPRILLLAHLDTVPVGELSAWKYDPFAGEIAEGKVYGRGVCDCKGRVAAYVFSVLAISKVLQALPCELSIAVTADEEIGGETGAKYLLESGRLECDYCIGEGYTWEVFHGFKGLLWLRISIKGVSAHGATPQLGASVVKPLENLLKELREYEARLASLSGVGNTTLNVGMIKAGTKINMVPDLATVDLDFRIAPTYKVHQVIDDVSTVMNRLERSHPELTFRLEILNQSEPIALASDHLLVTTVHSSVEEVSKQPIPVKLWFAHSDTLHFLRKGIPAVNYGVGRAGVPHAPDEHVYLEDLRLSTKAVALSVLKLLRGKFHGSS